MPEASAAHKLKRHYPIPKHKKKILMHANAKTRTHNVAHT